GIFENTVHIVYLGLDAKGFLVDGKIEPGLEYPPTLSRFYGIPKSSIFQFGTLEESVLGIHMSAYLYHKIVLPLVYPIDRGLIEHSFGKSVPIVQLVLYAKVRAPTEISIAFGIGSVQFTVRIDIVQCHPAKVSP